MSISKESYRMVMGRFATGVAIVTCKNDEEVNGTTANALTSVSLDPPLLLFCADNKSRTKEMISASGAFAVNILNVDQQEISNLFAQPGREKAKLLAELPTQTEVTASPILESCLAYLDCRVVASYEAGDHTIFVGEVKKSETISDRPPLIYYDGRYAKLQGS